MFNKSLLITLLTFALAISAFAAKQPQATTFDQMISHYDAIRIALLNDTTKDVQAHAREISTLARDAGNTFEASTVGVEPKDARRCADLLPTIRAEANALADAKNLESAREAFAKLSKSLIEMRKMSSSGAHPTVYYCSMAKESWMQTSGEVGNPYFGQKMARCGQVVE